MNHVNLTQSASVQVSRPAAILAAAAGLIPDNKIGVRGRFVVEHWRNGKRINEYHFPNGITTEGKNKLLDVMFHQATQIATWYLSLIDNSGYTALAAGDTYVNINQAGNGWDEFTNYTSGGSGTARPEWTEDAASAGQITNSTVAVFDITGSGTVKGVFLVGGIAGANTKGDHAAGGTLWATALFTSGDVPVQNGDQLKVTYTVTA
jgi:hypothetical protein